MKLHSLFQRLDEGRKEQLLDMMPKVFWDTNIGTAWKANVEWALQNLKKQDRVIWFLRVVKVKLLNSLDETRQKSPEEALELSKLIQKELDKTYKNMGITSETEKSQLSYYPLDRFKQNLNHYLVLGIPEIDRTVFDKQHPEVLLGEFRKIEKEWTERQTQTIKHKDVPDHAEIVIKFPDGKQWVNLHQTSCDVESKAMGHCGNKGSRNSYETILSLREPVKDGWRPLLTFILDTKTGSLGEMKGRSNDKPAPKYHPYILALLKDDMVKGVKGGGYKPQNNFKISDLSDSEQEALLTEKPELATWDYLYKKEGLTEVVKKKLKEQGINLYPEDEKGTNHFPLTDDGKFVIIDTYKSCTAFIDNYERYGLEKANAYIGYLNGDEFLEPNVDISQVESFYDDLPREYQTVIEKYVEQTYPDDFEETNDVVRILDNNSDEVYDALWQATNSAVVTGTESEIFDAYKSWLDGDIMDSGTPLITELGGSEGDYILDRPIRIICPTEKFMQQLVDEQNDQGDLDHINDGVILENMGFEDNLEDLPIPYYGFDGFDKEAGIERFKDEWPSVLGEEPIIEPKKKDK